MRRNFFALALLACAEPSSTPSPYSVPLAPDSPWPKFRRDAAQTGASPVLPERGGRFFRFATGKGIFSSPVVAGDGTIYVGSADRFFYAINPDGTERWRFPVGEIIDSSALLDDRGRVYVGAGDGFLYALDAATGMLVWKMEADDPSVNKAFIRWFEGNVAILPDGRLIAPNDNFFIYALDRDTGAVSWRFKVADQTWSLPAVDARTGRLFVGNNNLLPLLGKNTFALTQNGDEIWSASSIGSVAASPTLTPDGLVVVGGFDGFVRAYDARDGEERWSYGTRDHVYASPALHPNGLLVQPSADGSVYALDPATGRPRWTFDADEPLRSSPAIDGSGTIYLGSGEGRLFALNADGTLRWAMRLIDGDRNDLNASPALGRDAIYIAGETGEVFGVPYDHCLLVEDPRCVRGPDELLPDSGVHLRFMSRFGAPISPAPRAIERNQPMAFGLLVRAAKDTRLALFDSATATVSVDPPSAVRLTVSGDRKTITVTPTVSFTADARGKVHIRVRGDYLEGFERTGLKFVGGTRAGSYDESFELSLTPTIPAPFPLEIPRGPGESGGLLEISRLAAPLPTILPSYNQIGFDSLHYLVGVVEGGGGRAIGWFVGATLDAAGKAVVDPATKALFPLDLRWDGGLLSMENDDGLSLEVLSANISFARFLVRARLDASGRAADAAVVVATTICGEIEFYGPFLRTLGFCNPETDALEVFGAALLERRDRPPAPPAVGAVSFEIADDHVAARFATPSLPRAGHSVAILLVDAATGRAVSLAYGTKTSRSESGDKLARVRLEVPRVSLPARVRAYLMVDTAPAAMETLDVR